MTRLLEVYEYGIAYWLLFKEKRLAVEAGTFYTAVTTETGTVIRKAERQWRLVFENALGREGWLILDDWRTVSNGGDSSAWLKKQLVTDFPDLAQFDDTYVGVDFTRIRRRLAVDS